MRARLLAALRRGAIPRARELAFLVPLWLGATLGVNALLERWAETNVISEAMHAVQAIRIAEEVYRAEHGMFVDVESGPGSESWNVLGVHVEAPQAFRFEVFTGRGGVAPRVETTVNGTLIVWPVPDHDWYIVRATGHATGSGRVLKVTATSFGTDVFVERECGKR